MLSKVVSNVDVYERMKASSCHAADTCLMADDCPFVADCREVEGE